MALTPRQTAQAVELRRAGVSPIRITAELDTTLEEVQEVLAAIPFQSIDSMRREELDRLDRLQQAVWPGALSGDPGAVDRAMKLSAMRLRLAGVPIEGTALTDAYDKTIASLKLTDQDTALVILGRRLVMQMDAASASGDPTVENKAMYLAPHLFNVLKDLGATPIARQALIAQAEAAASKVTGQESDLDKFRKKRSARAAGA